MCVTYLARIYYHADVPRGRNTAHLRCEDQVASVAQESGMCVTRLARVHCHAFFASLRAVKNEVLRSLGTS